MIKKYTMGLVALLLTIVLVACGGEDKAEPTKQDGNLNEPVEISDKEKVADDEVVAVVNGTDVTGEVYNTVYAQLKQHANQMGQDLKEKEIKTAAIESLIDRELLMQEADEQGIEISDKEAEKEFKAIKKESKENLENILEQYQMTEQDFIGQLQFELTLNEFKAETIDVDVSDDEVKEIYEEEKEKNEKMPELAEIEDQLRANIEIQKVNEALEDKIAKVRETAKIENKMDA